MHTRGHYELFESQSTCATLESPPVVSLFLDSPVRARLLLPPDATNVYFVVQFAKEIPLLCSSPAGIFPNAVAISSARRP